MHLEVVLVIGLACWIVGILMTYIEPKCGHACAGCLHEKYQREQRELARRARTSHSALHEWLYPGGIGCPFFEDKEG